MTDTRCILSDVPYLGWCEVGKVVVLLVAYVQVIRHPRAWSLASVRCVYDFIRPFFEHCQCHVFMDTESKFIQLRAFE